MSDSEYKGKWKCIEVAVPLPVWSTYTYEVPAELRACIAAGKRVWVPFGSRRITGFVLGPAGKPSDDQKLKPISDVIDDISLFPQRMRQFFQWISDYYIHPMGEVIQTALPAGLVAAERAAYAITDQGRSVLNDELTDDSIRTVLKRLAHCDCRYDRLVRETGVRLSRGTLNNWVTRGWVARRLTLSGDRTRTKTQKYYIPIADDTEQVRLSEPRRKILDLLKTRGPMPLSEIKEHVPTATGLLRAMQKDGQLRAEDRTVFRDPFGETITPDRPPELSAEQRRAIAEMAPPLGKGFQTYLLAGVTGSGKTEIYLQLAARALQMQLPVLVLVPEIALISQMERAFRARFGECVALLHSGLSSGERYDQWRRIAQGEIPIAIGARSAVFAPFNRVGLVIVDEEHDDSYKQEGTLRYNARDLAVVRARQDEGLAVLGSATPSVQSIYNVQHNKYKQVRLMQRVDRSVLPRIILQDLTQLREERGIRRLLAPVLLEAIAETLARKQQVLLFLNRRGFASTLVCGTCGQALRCDRCDISLTYHRSVNAYRCHYCGFSRAAAARCGACGSPNIKRLGVGTEQLSEQIRGMFPAARVARMDRDTTRRKGSLLKILKALREQKIDILVGTQMVAKGHDYPNITLVGIVCADLSLSMPDFRAGERTFQLLAQVAGRAGRGQAPGRVVLQTFNPDHFSITAARHQDHEAFYRQEIQFRKALGYPPFSRMIQVRINGRDKERTAGQARRIGGICERLLKEDRQFASVQVLGPIEAPLARIADYYRWQILLKGPHSRILHQLVRDLLAGAPAPTGKDGTMVSVDVDPIFLM